MKLQYNMYNRIILVLFHDKIFLIVYYIFYITTIYFMLELCNKL